MPSPVWYHLRASRSDPPALAGTDESRRQIYVASLAQFEELMGASSNVTAATRPLTIFYALAQAGRAIVAAHSQNAPPITHGITTLDPEPELMRTQVVVRE